MRLETYPETRFARLVGTNAEINLYRLKEEPKLEKSGVVFEGLEDGFSLHPVVTPDSGVGVAMASFPGDLREEPKTLLEAPIMRKVPVTPEPAVPTASSTSETMRNKREKEKEKPKNSSARSANSSAR